MTRAVRLIAGVQLLIACLSGQAHAQVTHYSTIQYGPRASLLGGAVVGSANDVSATFYNPGGLALADSLGFAISLNAFERLRAVAEGGLIGSEDLSTSRTRFAPGMLGGALPRAEESRHVFAYSFITRQRARTSVTDVGTIDPPGYETVVRQLTLDRDVTERWFGGSWAYTLRPHLGVGATTYLAVRSDARIIGAGVAGVQFGDGFTFSRARSYRYQQYAVVAKLGALLDYPAIGIGTTVTLPSLRVAGSGDVTFANVDVGDGVGLPETLIAVSGEDGTAATYKTPLSIGLGLRAGISAFKMYASAEWFSSIDAYRVIASDPFVAQTPSDEYQFVVSDIRASVLNWSVALEQRVSDDIITYLSFRTDASANKALEADLLLAPLDIRTISAGADFRIRGKSLTLGGSFGWATSTSQGLGSLFPEDVLRPPLGYEPVSITYNKFGIVLGFEL